MIRALPAAELVAPSLVYAALELAGVRSTIHHDLIRDGVHLDGLLEEPVDGQRVGVLAVVSGARECWGDDPGAVPPAIAEQAQQAALAFGLDRVLIPTLVGQEVRLYERDVDLRGASRSDCAQWAAARTERRTVRQAVRA